MHSIASTTPSAPHQAATVTPVCAAEQALNPQAQTDTLKHLADMASDTSPQQQAEHIRSMVAISLAHLSAHASAATRAYAERWQAWALGLASQLEQPVGA